MRYSWAKFGVGVVAGLGAFAIAFADDFDFHVLASLLLWFLSIALMFQAPKASQVEDPPFTSEREEEEWRQLDLWQQLGRDAIAGLRNTVRPIFWLLWAMLLWSIAEREFPDLTTVVGEFSSLIVVLALSAWWLTQVVAAFRSGRERRSVVAEDRLQM